MTDRNKPAEGYTVRCLPYSDGNDGKPWVAEGGPKGLWAQQFFATEAEAIAWTHESKFYESGVTGT